MADVERLKTYRKQRPSSRLKAAFRPSGAKSYKKHGCEISSGGVAGSSGWAGAMDAGVLDVGGVVGVVCG